MSRDTRSAGDQIEFLPPNDSAFGMADVADFVGFDGIDENVFDDDEPHSKWLAALASVVILGLIGVGVIAAAPWDGSGSTSPTTSSTPATTVADTTTTERVIDVLAAGPPGFLIGDPGEFQLAGVWSVGPEYRQQEGPTDDWFDLWATPDAARTRGRWLAVTSLRGRGDYYETRPDGMRIAAGIDTGVLATSADGVTRLIFTANDDTPFEVGGFGFTLPDLLTVADQIGTREDGFLIDYGGLLDGILAGLRPTVSLPVPAGGLNAFNLLGQPEAGTHYINRDFTSTLWVNVSEPGNVDSAVYDFLMPQVTDLTLADRTTLDALRREGVPVRVRADPESSSVVASWTTAQSAVTVSGVNVTASTIIGMLPSLRLADQTEWAELIDRSNHGLLDVDYPDEESPLDPIVIGRDQAGPDGQFWIIQMATDPAAVSVESDQTGWYGPVGDISSTPAVRQYASQTITFLVATAQWPSTARQVRITVEGQPPVDLPMVQVGNSTVYAAGYAFTEVAGSTVEFFDDAGNPVAS